MKNNNRQQYRRLLKAAFIVAFFVVYGFMMLGCWIRYYHPGMERQFFFKGHMVLMCSYLIGTYALGRVYGSWKIGNSRTFQLVFSQTITTFMMNGIMYTAFILLTKHVEKIVPVFALSVLQILYTYFWAESCNWIYRKCYPSKRAVLITGLRTSEALEEKLAEQEERFKITGKIKFSSESALKVVNEEAAKYDVVVLGDIPSQYRNDILKKCYHNGQEVYLLPKLSDILIRAAERQQFSDSAVLMVRNNELTAEQEVVKRGMDVIVAGLALVMLSPILLLVALCIHFEDGGPVIYRQVRLTKNGREFNVLKFRSMRVDAEKDGVQRLAQENDSRVTKVGKVIRAVRLDELPQLFNILKGDMSLVGPRPERPELAKVYEESIPEFSYRLKVKAGLTGFAQVYGKYNTTAYEKLKLDLMYIQNYSLAMDIEILFKTIQILFMKESTEGVESGKENAL